MSRHYPTQKWKDLQRSEAEFRARHPRRVAGSNARRLLKGQRRRARGAKG